LKFYEGPWIVNERGIGAFSFWRFPIDSPTASVKPIASSEEHFAVYPNPASNYASFIITLEKPDDVTIELYDLLGRKVKTVVEESLAAGTYKIPFQIENYFAQAMIARLRTSDGLQSLQVMTSR
jgi:serine protease AprX